MSIKVLVADDSITIQKVIGIIFGSDEYSLTIVDNGKAAVDKALEINPDILLIDALMPGMTGYEAAEMIRATPLLATKPILILTGSFEPFDEEKAKECGADDFISKPFESQQIITKVKELLELGRSRAQSIQSIQSQAAPEVHSEQPLEVPQPLVPDDIWGAFTSEAESPVEVAAAPELVVPAVTEPVMANADFDVFAIVSEESDAGFVQSATPSTTSPSHTGSQWVPVEENTFEFDEDPTLDPPQPLFAEQTAPVMAASFGDIIFEEEVETTQAPPEFEAVYEQPYADPAMDFASPEPAFADSFAPEPVFEEPVAVEPVASLLNSASASVDSVETAPLLSASALSVPQLTEEQLKAALALVSKDVIERIVWEIVPDLAEALIRDAIRKIKEGA